jgi:rod shape-determining protein MreC
MSASLFNLKHGVISYFKLREVNQDLLEENALLKDQVLNKELKVGKRYVKLKDSLYYKNYKFIEAKIINSQFKFAENNLLINRGKLNGVSSKMGLIGTRGVYGIVDNVSDHYASVQPLIHEKFGLTVIHKKTNTWGDFKWVPGENNFRTAYVENVPIYTEINLTDIFSTTGSDGIFPEDIKVGSVIKIEKNKEQQTLKITIELEEDFSSARVGYVVKNFMNEEINEHYRN